MKLPRLLSVLSFALLSLLATEAAAAGWIRARTEHFDLYSAASEDESRRYLNELERFHAAFHRLFGWTPTGGPRVTVVMFDSGRQFQPFQPLYKGRPRNVAGFYRRGADGDFIALSAEAQEWGGSDDNVILHECVHRMFEDQGFKLPLWLSEGLAVFFATMRVEDGFVEIGHPAQRRLNGIARAPLMPLGKLFAVTQASPDYNEDAVTNVFYAQSWLLVHHLICGTDKNIQGKLAEFVEAACATSPVAEPRFREIFGMSYDDMETALRGYMTGGGFKVRRFALQTDDFADKIRFDPVDDVERDCVLEDLRWRVRPDGSVPRRLRKIAERHPEDARPWEILAAHALSQERDRAQAETYWRKAADLGSENPVVHLQLAKTGLFPVARTLDLKRTLTEAQCVPLRARLDRALELRPGYVEAWETLAQLEAFSASPRPAVLEKIAAVAHATRNAGNTFAALALAHWRAGDFVACEAMLREVERARPGPTAQSMVRMLNQQLGPEGPRRSESLRPRS